MTNGFYYQADSPSTGAKRNFYDIIVNAQMIPTVVIRHLFHFILRPLLERDMTSSFLRVETSCEWHRKLTQTRSNRSKSIKSIRWHKCKLNNGGDQLQNADCAANTHTSVVVLKVGLASKSLFKGTTHLGLWDFDQETRSRRCQHCSDTMVTEKNAAAAAALLAAP